MLRRPPRSTRTDTLFPDTTLFRSKIVQMMREAGAAEVHMRIASPPTRHSCFYGVDTPERAKLLAAKMNLDEMTNYIQADSLAFVSIDGLYKALGETHRADIRPSHSDACFTGAYPDRNRVVSGKRLSGRV